MCYNSTTSCCYYYYYYWLIEQSPVFWVLHIGGYWCRDCLLQCWLSFLWHFLWFSSLFSSGFWQGSYMSMSSNIRQVYSLSHFSFGVLGFLVLLESLKWQGLIFLGRFHLWFQVSPIFLGSFDINLHHMLVPVAFLVPMPTITASGLAAVCSWMLTTLFLGMPTLAFVSLLRPPPPRTQKGS